MKRGSIFAAFWILFQLIGGSSQAFDAASSQEEVKLLVAEKQIERALSSLDAQPRFAERRTVYFFDTPGLVLFDSGVILRGRTSKDESTVKLRPAIPSRIPEKFHKLDGFKCEMDRTLRTKVISCSLTSPQGEGEVKRAGQGKREPKKLFSGLQEDFARFIFGEKDFPWEKLRSYGPISAMEWEINGGGEIGKFKLELWRLPSGKAFLEASLRVPESAGPEFLRKIAAYFAKRSIRVQSSGESKTRGALIDLH